MNKNWLKTVISLVIVSFLFSPIAMASSEDTSFFAGIGSLIRGDVIFSSIFADPFIVDKDARPTIGGSSFMYANTPGLAYTPINENWRLYTITITAYSSSVDETDSTPFITASGSRTRDGVVAANFLPFGSQVKIPELFGDKTFVVEDRMNRRFTERMDIWFPSKGAAKKFGKRTAQIVVFDEI